MTADHIGGHRFRAQAGKVVAVWILLNATFHVKHARNFAFSNDVSSMRTLVYLKFYSLQNSFFLFNFELIDFSMQYLRAHRANSLFKRRKFFEGSWMGKYSSVFVPGACSSSIMIRLPEIRVKFAPIILYSYLIHIEGEHQFSKGTLLDDPYRRLKAWREMIMLFSRQFFLYTRLKRVRIFIFIFIFRYSSEWKSLMATRLFIFVSSYTRDKRKLD